MPAISGSRWPFAAREGEFGVLAGAWRSRRCQGVAVFGPAGVGKTRLAEEFLAGVAGKDGVRAARVTASVEAGAAPLAAIAHVIPAGVDVSVQGFAEVARVLAGPDRSRRWVVMVDELHLLDVASALLLRQLVDAGVVRLIATVRSGEPVEEAVAALLAGEALHRVDLEPFTRAQVEQVLQAGLGGPVAARTAHQLAALSGGNARILRELVLGGLADGSLGWDEEIWQLERDGSGAGTPKLAELVGARLAEADAVGGCVLDLLAVCEPVGLEDVEAVAGGPRPVEFLERAGLLRVAVQGHRIVVGLAHPLHGEMLRERLPLLRRRQLLLEQAGRVRAHGARRGEDALHIATWQLAATGTADLDLLVRAAALGRHVRYCQAGSLLQALPEEAHTVHSRVMLGEVLFELGQCDQADKVLARAARDAVDEQEVLATAVAHSFSLSALARTAEALAVTARARKRISERHALRVLRHADGSTLIAACDPVQGLACLDDLEADIRDASDPAAWAVGARMKGIGLELIGRGEQGLALVRRAYEYHLAVKDRIPQHPPAFELVSYAWVLRGLGRLDEARAIGEQGYFDFTDAGATQLRIWTAVNLARVEWLAGRPTTARRWYADAAAQIRASDNLSSFKPALHGLAACAAVLGDLKTADRALAEAHTLPDTGFYATFEAAAPAWVRAAQGDLSSARTLLTRAADAAREASLLTAESIFLTDIARLGGAKDVTQRLTDLASTCEGAFLPARAHLAAGLARNDPDQLLAAADELNTIGSHLLAAEAVTAAAAAHHGAGNSRKAAAAAHRAQPHVAQCEGIRTPLLAAVATSQLTPRERDVALLAARGTPSQDIARALDLSVRTVENHLQHAYTKLGVTSRRELAHTVNTHPVPRQVAGGSGGARQ